MPDRRKFIAFAVLAEALWRATPARAAEAKHEHRIVFQLTDNDPQRMTMILDNIANVSRYYADKGDSVEFEVVVYGPGLHMLRADTSPVKERVKSIKLSIPDVAFTACGNTIESMEKAEGRKIELLPQVGVAPAGVARLAELQEQGWSYVRP